MAINWNPWHGCHKYSEGCKNCYVFRGDAKYDRNSDAVKKNNDFSLPVRLKRDGGFKVPSGEYVYLCFSSDFLLADADEWRKEAWDYIRLRKDLRFLFITKRILRFSECVPPDWGDGWEHVAVCCTCENQKRVDERLPVYLSLPIKHRSIICEPLLSAIDLRPYLSDKVESVVVGGESGEKARVCDYRWVLSIKEQCDAAGVKFIFKQTGARFLKDGRLYEIERKYQHSQAKKAGLNTGALI